jgi:son of sevenless-like protein
MKSCLFCTLASNQENIIYQTDLVYVILDRYPCSDRHFLVIPREHHDVIDKYDSKSRNEIMDVIVHIVKKFNMKKYNILQNNINGQIVPHVHFHLVEANETGCLKIDGAAILRLDDSEYRSLVQRTIGQLSSSN